VAGKLAKKAPRSGGRGGKVAKRALAVAGGVAGSAGRRRGGGRAGRESFSGRRHLFRMVNCRFSRVFGLNDKPIAERNQGGDSEQEKWSFRLAFC
jgi:hypothetical protein